MNVVELLAVLFVLALGYLMGRLLGHSYGLVGWVGGFLLGVGLAVLIYSAFRRFIGVTGKPRNS